MKELPDDLISTVRGGEREKVVMALTGNPDLLAALPPAAPSPSAPCPSRDDATIAATLLTAGADVNAGAHGGVTALHLAADAGDADLVALFIDRGAAIDPMLSLWQATPAHLAAAHGHHHIVTLLQQAGADLTLRDSYGRSVTEIQRTSIPIIFK